MSKFQKIKILFSYIVKLFTVINYKDLVVGFLKLPIRLSNNLDFIFNNSIVKNIPTHVIIELTNVCNLKCVMCPSPIQKRAKGFMAKEDFILLMSQLAGKIELIDFDLYGEILIHPEYDWFIAYAKGMKIKTSVSTNATFLNSEHIDRLINSGLDFLIISVDGEEEASYNHIRKGAAFNKTIENVENFLNKNQNKIFTIVQKIHMSSNVESTWSYLETMKHLRPNLLRLKPYRDQFKGKEYLRVQDKKNISEIKCPYLWKIPVLTWNGGMVPCCNDYDATMSFGSGIASSVSSLWNAPAFVKMRETHIAKGKESISLCQNCSAVDFNFLTVFASSFFDGLNSRKILSVIQTIKILLLNFNT